MTLKIIAKKKYWDETVLLTIFITRKFELHGVFLWIKDADPVVVISRIQIRVTQKDRIRPDPDPQH